MLNDVLLEIFSKFLRQQYGSSLIIKGKPGAGKTTFALELLDSLRNEAPAYYITTRFSNDPLTDRFPWINDISTGPKSRNRNVENLNDAFREHLEKLERMIEEGKVSKNFGATGTPGIVLNIEEILPELEALYGFVSQNINAKPVVVVDSIEAMAEKYDLDPEILFQTIQKDLVEKSGANIIMVMEQDRSTSLDYYADGVVRMGFEYFNNFLIRTVTIEKLRGVSIGSSPIYLYSLDSGHFQSFKREQIIYPNQRIKKIAKAEDKQFEVSLGLREFSKLFPSGTDKVQLGSVIMIHRQTQSNVVDQYVNLFKNNIIKYSIGNGRGVLDVTSSTYETSRVLVATMEPDILKHYITAEKTEKSSPFIINIGGKSMSEDFPREVIDYYMTNSRKPLVYIFSTDFLKFTYGDNFVGDFSTIINNIRPTGVVIIVADDEEYRKMYHYSTFSIHVNDINGYVIFNSDSANMFLGSLSYDEEKWPDIKLSFVA
ncbi:MAG: hypothetical protein M1605_03815 [Candidatus Thermoplasmatota archaeon]|nr:hypothetical protein [Candidatus Thermoplasmatota archaeon]